MNWKGWNPNLGIVKTKHELRNRINQNFTYSINQNIVYQVLHWQAHNHWNSIQLHLIVYVLVSRKILIEQALSNYFYYNDLSHLCIIDLTDYIKTTIKLTNIFFKVLILILTINSGRTFFWINLPFVSFLIFWSFLFFKPC
jgi:hypothetical protein